MLIYDLKTYFPPRAVEWLVSGMLISWGVSVILQPGMFIENNSFHYMLTIAKQESWGLYATAVGSARALALFINGTWQRTPIIRVISCFCSAFVWTQILLAMTQSPVPTTSWAIFGWLIAADCYSAFRAAADAVTAKDNEAVYTDSKV